MSRFVPCSIKPLPEERWVTAARTAIRINPANAPALHLRKLVEARREVSTAELRAIASSMSASAIKRAALRVDHRMEEPTTDLGDHEMRTRLAVVTSKYWGCDGVRLTVGFLDTNDSALKARILLHMNSWSAWANVAFEESATDPQVRISRVAPNKDGDGGGYWSNLGTDILHQDADRATMNLEGFTMNTPDSEFHRVVRHETGHTLGFPHEHLRSEIVDRIDREKAIAYFMAAENWSKDEVIDQVLTPLGLSAPLGTLHADTDSIMCYWLPSEIMKDGNSVSGGNDIDDQDAQFAAIIYPGQVDWRLCSKCHALFFSGGGSQGSCPAGDAHDPTGSGNYSLVQNAVTSAVQSNWRWCRKCQGLFFAGSSNQGVCPAGGAHDHAGSGNYGLAQNLSPREPGQNDWRWCSKCQGLHRDQRPAPGVCPAGGDHAQAGSGDYRLLMFTPPPPLPANYGSFDAMVTLPNGKTYATFGDQYVRYSVPSGYQADAGYPKPIAGNWGILPAEFLAGFDSMATLPDGKTYVTKGGRYVRYSDPNANVVDPTYPRPIAGNWGHIPAAFETGFDSMATLPDGKTYITRGSQYVRYSDKSANRVDPGYPRPIAGNWGMLPFEFLSGFDCMVVTPNGKTYIMRGGQYVRYSDPSANRVDQGYPKPILGNWG